MKRLLLASLLAAAALVPVAAAAPATPHVLRGTVVAKDRAHRGLVVALPGGAVQTVVAPQAFGRTRIGRSVAIRYSVVAGRLPVALGVSFKGQVRNAIVRGTVVRIVKRNAVINAGGTALRVHLTAAKAKRKLASVLANPVPTPDLSVGDTVEVDVEIDDDGSLGGSAVVVGASAGPQVGSEGTMEVRGKVASTGFVPATSSTTGWIPIATSAATVGCVIPIGMTLNVHPGDMIELKCDLIGKDWTVRAAHGEDGHSAAGGDDASEVKVRGVLGFSGDGQSVIVTPPSPGLPVSCAIPSSVMAQLKARFTSGDLVKMECVKVGDTPTLKEIEKIGHDDESNGANNDDNDDDGGQSGDTGGDSGDNGGD